MLNSFVSSILLTSIHIIPIGNGNNPFSLDFMTLLFCVAIVILTVAITTHNRKFHLIIQSLFSQRIRTQFVREVKLFDEWIYAILLLFIFLVQSTFLYLLTEDFLPGIGNHFQSLVLFAIIFAAVALDYFLKLLNLKFITYLFDYKEERTSFNQNKFLAHTINSLTLLPIMIAAVYTGYHEILWFYAPFFLGTYLLLIYRTITLNIKNLNPFQFFLYFCTLEILPYLIILKVLITADKVLI